MNIDLVYDMQKNDTSGPNRAKPKNTVQHLAVKTKAPLSGGSRKRSVVSTCTNLGMICGNVDISNARWGISC